MIAFWHISSKNIPSYTSELKRTKSAFVMLFVNCVMLFWGFKYIISNAVATFLLARKIMYFKWLQVSLRIYNTAGPKKSNY